jgi:hypothetical protein
MKLKSWWYDTKSTKWQIIFGTLLIGSVFVGTFSFLETYQFEEWKYSGFAKSMIGILMGTVALGVITGVIIIFQSIVSMDREKNQKIFDERLALYKQFIKKTTDIISDDKLVDEERHELKILEKEVLMIASPNTYDKWSSLYKDILKLKSTEDEKIDNEDQIRLSISDKSIDFVNSCRMDLEIGVVDTKTIESSKKESRIEISRKWTVSDFKNYDVWLSQRLNTDKNIKPEMIEIHRSIHDFVMDNFPNIDVKYVLDGASLKHPNGKKVGNINVFSGKGVVLNLLRSEKDGFRLPNINHKCVNARNDMKNCSYYFITNISVLDSEIKEQLQNSYDIRDKNKNILTNKNPQIKEILGLE